jgi:hypothetical protein
LGDVYFRTLRANGTPSTAVARPQDWLEIVEICFENREADVGRFLRRQLAALDLSTLVAALNQLGLTGIAASAVPDALGGAGTTWPAALRERAMALLGEGSDRFKNALEARTLNPEEQKLADAGSWSVALAINPPRTDKLPDQVFRSTLASSNPRYTGWPVWLDSSGFTDESARPKVLDKAWEALIVSPAHAAGHLDCLRLDPKGEFYLRRNLQDDTTDKVKPFTYLDPVLVIIRVAEAIAVGLSFAKALGWEPEPTRLGYAFRWTKLKGRCLASWANRQAYLSADYGPAHEDEVTSYIELSLDTPITAISPAVDQATQDLFVLFDGFRMPVTSIEHWVQRLIERKL